MRADVEQNDLLLDESHDQHDAVFVGQTHSVLTRMPSLQRLKSEARRVGVGLQLAEDILEKPFKCRMPTKELPRRAVSEENGNRED